MSKIRTLTQLQSALDEEMAWRLKDISVFKIATKGKSVESVTFIRAGVALLYAHWEGFIKNSAEKYLNFVESQGHTYEQLRSCFAVLGLKGHLVMLSESRKTEPNIDAFDFIRSAMGQKAHLVMSGAINTESNLKSHVLKNIAHTINISIDPYESKFKLIDESLVVRRNKVAHGEFLDLHRDDFVKLIDEVVRLMREFKTDIENAATLKSYMRA
ncbi:MAG: hypothetical protein KDJ44_00590 [Rhodoblastus sp.]|nr:hypothetical protein [Rhodoblastus sp.]